MMPKSLRERFFKHPKIGPISEGSEVQAESNWPPPPPLNFFEKWSLAREDQEGLVSHAGSILLKQRSAD